MISYLCRYGDKDIYLHHAADQKPDKTDFPLHTHNSCEILGCIRGKGKYIVEGSEYHLEPGCILVMRPMEAHMLQVDPSEPYERIMINFSYDLIRLIDPEEKLLTLFHDRPLGQHNLYRSHEFTSINGITFLKEMVAPTNSSEERRLNAIVNLFPLLNTLKSVFACKKINEGEWVNRNTPQLIIEYVNNHLHEALSLDILSEHFFLSKSQISRIFKKATGSSVHNYIVIKRLMRAREYMMNGESAGNACQLCGFDHYSSFYRSYKKHFGISPTDLKFTSVSDA